MLTEKQVREAISASGVDCDAQVIESKALFSDLGFDSLDIYNVIMAVQDVAGVDIPDGDIEKLQSIHAIIEYFATK